MLLQIDNPKAYVGQLIDDQYQVIESFYINPGTFFIWDRLNDTMLYDIKDRHNTLFFNNIEAAEKYLDGNGKRKKKRSKPPMSF